MNEKINIKKASWLKRRKRLLLGLGTIVLMFLMFLFVDITSLFFKIATIGLLGLIFFVILYTIAFIIRAFRLKLIFKGLNQNITYSTCYFSLGVSFVINDLTLGKLGDLAKIGFIKDQTEVKLSESVCGVAIERVSDLIILFCISCFALIYLYINNLRGDVDKIILGQSIQFYLLIGALMIVAILFILILLIYKTMFIIKIVGRISTKLADILGKFFINFKKGMKQFKDHKIEFVFTILLGFIIWIIEAFIVVIFFYILGYELNILILILAMILSIFSRTFQITPGGWGISENIGALFVFLFYPEIPFTEILSVFIIDHLFRSIYLFVFGGYSVFRYNVKMKEI